MKDKPRFYVYFGKSNGKQIEKCVVPSMEAAIRWGYDCAFGSGGELHVYDSRDRLLKRMVINSIWSNVRGEDKDRE